MLLGRILKRILSLGQLRIVDARGAAHTIEGSPGGNVTIRLHDPALHW
jgi:hypothetical protein